MTAKVTNEFRFGDYTPPGSELQLFMDAFGGGTGHTWKFAPKGRGFNELDAFFGELGAARDALMAQGGIYADYDVANAEASRLAAEDNVFGYDVLLWVFSQKIPALDNRVRSIEETVF